MNDLIRDWMNRGCPYWEGVALYEQLGSNVAVKNILRLGDSAFFIEKLKQAMLEMLSGGEKVVNERVEKGIRNKELGIKVAQGGTEKKEEEKMIEIRSYRRGDIYLLPEDVGGLVKLKGQTYKDAATLHGTLLKGEDADKRKLAAFEILRLMAINQNCWNSLNYFDKYGALPVEQSGVDYNTMGSGDRDLLIQRHRVYLSRHKWLLEPDAIEHPKYLYFSKEYRRRKKELEELEKVA